MADPLKSFSSLSSPTSLSLSRSLGESDTGSIKFLPEFDAFRDISNLSLSRSLWVSGCGQRESSTLWKWNDEFNSNVRRKLIWGGSKWPGPIMTQSKQSRVNWARIQWYLGPVAVWAGESGIVRVNSDCEFFFSSVGLFVVKSMDIFGCFANLMKLTRQARRVPPVHDYNSIHGSFLRGK